ncbi:BnaAnng34310D [Brassica napus]|uniref:BnaAnng34310D protein n=1 Tax=Brassica napus TaxID=3708 RepID=A0A078JVW7_BRANA|nr:BnaAnng34310D [Brassica napus]
MPLLHTLEIWDCPKLKELPDGLRFIISLKIRQQLKETLSNYGLSVANRDFHGTQGVDDAVKLFDKMSY